MITIMLLSLVLSANAMPCPEGCSCGWTKAILQVDCSNLGLTEVPDFDDMPVEILNLSNNLIKEFPTKLSQIKTLTNLNLSGNLITTMKMTSLVGFTSLNALILSDNGISNWKDLSPNTVLLPAINLHTLSLARNPLNTLSSSSQDLLFVSNSLKLLDLSECGISKVMGQFVLQGLTKLEKLILTGNPIRYFTPLTSNSLNLLELKNCSLTKIPANSFTDLPKLITLDLSHNPRLTLTSKPGEYAQSESVQNLDLGYCNKDLVHLSGFPNLINLNLRYNMLMALTNETFRRNQLLKNLQISNNRIREIGQDTFSELKYLEHLDLSDNKIARVDENLFLENRVLININFSENKIKTLRKMFPSSIVRLDFSGCEIRRIDENALAELPNLIKLNLSKNLLSEIPSLESSSLTHLNLKIFRITSIGNNTFQNISSLMSLDLSGNLLTTPPKVEYFNGNKHLNEIWLYDNPWRCDCEDPSFYASFYKFKQDLKMTSSIQELKCASPSAANGSTWFDACQNTWYNKTEDTSWNMGILATVTISVALILGVIYKYAKIKKLRIPRIYAIIMRKMRWIYEWLRRRVCGEQRINSDPSAQELGQDSREDDPPPYHEAVNWPKPNRAYISMATLKDMGQQQSCPDNKHNLHYLSTRTEGSSPTEDLAKTHSRLQNLDGIEKNANLQRRGNNSCRQLEPNSIHHEEIPLCSGQTESKPFASLLQQQSPDSNSS